MNSNTLVNNNLGVHMGRLVKQKFTQSNLTREEFAKSISCVVGHVHKIFARKEIDVSLLKRISRTLNYDFFQHYSEELYPDKGNMVLVKIEFQIPKKELDADDALCRYCKAERVGFTVEYL